ncbi:MAG: aldehyde ferredoxin oxidoreductase family protein [Planctomycetales bacterium]|nr:aldehyde ferredoxin oxidoreductase family protein [Planctomycetales bacterium]
MKRELFGYHGGYRRIKLNELGATSEFVPLPDEILRRFLGGSGLGVSILLSEGQATVDPLSPDAGIAFVFSPLVGSAITTSAKFAVVCKSPLTERFNDALASSAFAISGKQSGCDAIYITGYARLPSVLVIDDNYVSLHSADDLWGRTTADAEVQLRARFGADFDFAVIGPAGENRVRYATISHDNRHAGRGGSGAVLGAKNIKAIAVRGTKRCEWADASRLAELSKSISQKSFGPATSKYRELGTASNLLVFNRLHALPTRNFQSGSFEHAEAISPESLSVARERTRSSCAACTIGCEHIYQIRLDGGPEKGVRLEYESLFSLGSLCGVGNPEHVLAASRRCDELGLDTISTGGTIAFAMECVERGLLDCEWLKFGDGDAVLRVIELIATRGESERGLGNRLAEGSKRAAEMIGGDAFKFAPHVKGLEIPGYEPRALQTMALGFAVGTRGADHNRSGAYEIDFSSQSDRRRITKADVAAAIETEDKAAIMDSLILCKFLRGIFDDLFAESATMLKYVTGWDVTGDELRSTAKQIVSAKRAFNRQAGWTPDEDVLPERFYSTALPDDTKADLDRIAFEEATAEYYRLRDQPGVYLRSS